MPDRAISFVVICHSYPPVLGGSEIEAQRVCEALQARGHKAQVVCAGGDPMPPGKTWVDPCGVPVRMFGARWKEPLRSYAYALGVGWTLWRERHNYEVAYFLMQGLQLITGLPVAALLGKPIVMKFSCSNLVAQMMGSLAGRIEVRFLKWWADKILVLNPGMRQEALEAGFAASKVGWMPNPVDVSQFQPVTAEEKRRKRRQLGVDEEAGLVVYVGRLDDQKKLPWLLGAFAKVARERPEVQFALIGDGPLRNEVARWVEELGLKDRARLCGRLPMSGVLEWLQAGDVFPMTSEMEGLPCALIEAMAAGLVPVVTHIPAHSQLIDHEVHGMLTEVGNVDATAASLLRVLDDPELRARLAANARRRMIDEFSTARVADCYEELFEEVSGREQVRVAV